MQYFSVVEVADEKTRQMLNIKLAEIKQSQMKLISNLMQTIAKQETVIKKHHSDTSNITEELARY